jgi:hypothetical protein
MFVVCVKKITLSTKKSWICRSGSSTLNNHVIHHNLNNKPIYCMIVNNENCPYLFLFLVMAGGGVYQAPT